MTRQEELIAKKSDLELAIKNVLEGGQEFQTRNARVKQVPLEVLEAQLATVEQQLSALGNNGMTKVVKLVYGGCR